MCVRPVQVPNPSRVPNPREWLMNHPFERRKDLTSAYIRVPCGHCVECVRLQQNYWIQRFRLMASVSDMYYQTLTLKPSMTPHLKLTFENGDTFDKEIVTRDMLQKYFKRLRKDNVFGTQFKYFAVSEYGGKRHRPHFHIVYFVPKTDDPLAVKVGRGNKLKWELFEYWSRNDGTRKNPVYIPYCEYHEKHVGSKIFRNYDFHYIVPSATQNGTSDVGFYVSKYILKFSGYVDSVIHLFWHNLNPDDLPGAISSFRPFLLCSKNFGSVSPDKWKADFTEFNNIIDVCKQKSLTSCRNGTNKFDSFLFYTPDGKAFPLSPLLRKKYIRGDDVLQMFDIQRVRHSDDYMNDYDAARYDDLDFDRLSNSAREENKLRKHIESINDLWQF